MARSKESRDLSRLLTIVSTVVAIAALHLAKDVFLPLALAMLFSFLLAPLVTLLERGRIPRLLAILLVLLAFGTGAGMLGWTIVTQLIQVTSHLPEYRDNISDKVQTMHQTSSTSLSQAQHEVEHLSEQIGISHPPPAHERRREAQLLNGTQERPIIVKEAGDTGIPFHSLQAWLEPLVFLLLVVVFTFFMLLQRESMRNRFIRLTGHGHLNLMTQAMDEASQRVSRYFSLQLLVNTSYGAIIFIGLHVIGLPHAPLWGALAGLFRFIPYLGAPTAAALPTLLSMAVFHGWNRTFAIMGLFFLMEVLTANFIEPHLYGKHTGLSSLAILVAAVFWTLIWGPIGLILSVPLTVCLVVVGAHVPNLEFLKVLLGDQPVMRPQAHYYQRLLASDEHEAGEVLETYLKDHSLAELYDCVLVRALALFEQDRHRNALDDSTVAFITQTTREFIDDLSMRTLDSSSTTSTTGETQDAKAVEDFPASKQTVVCLPVRDTSDELIARMLCQMLEQAGHTSYVVPLQTPEEMLTRVAELHPDQICLSALPPFALSHTRDLYRRLRSQFPQINPILGVWNYTGDPAKTAREITRGSQDQLLTSLAAVLEVFQPHSSKMEESAQATDPLDTATSESEGMVSNPRS